MKTFTSVTAVAALAAVSNALSNDELCMPTCNEEGTLCTFFVSIDIYAGETGYYKFNNPGQGCENVQPTLGLKAGVKHVFNQSNVTNWFHPVGLAYGPDGVYGDNTELEPFVADPAGQDKDCEAENATVKCQHPQYVLNGENLCSAEIIDGVCSDEGDFGLDEYEGVYFSGGRDDWIDAGDFHVEVTVTDPLTTEMFYFCHIHNFMSGRIKVLDEDGNQRSEEDIVPIPYEYNFPSEFDQFCGTYGAVDFRTDGDSAKCDGMKFLCGEIDHSAFGQCMSAIDCKMHEEMRTEYLNKDIATTFMHQMISHHQNAVNMAKILLKANPPSLRCGTDYDGRRRLQEDFDEEFCHDGNDDGNAPFETMLWEIINGQNAQITFMRAWLEDNLQLAEDICPSDATLPKKALGVIGGLAAVAGLAVVGAGVVTMQYNKVKKQLPVETKEVATKDVEEKKEEEKKVEKADI